jgi:integrase
MLVRVVGVKRFKDRHGIERAYYRRKGAPAVAIDLTLGNAALIAEVARLDALYVVPKAKAGTLGQLIGQYKAKSNHWGGLRARTREDYERVFTWLGRGVDSPLSGITTPEIAKARDRARDEHEPKFANQVVTTLKKVLQFGKEYGFVKTNAATGVSKATGGNKRENRPPTPQEASILLNTAPAALKPVIALPIYTALRLGDVTIASKAADKGEWIETIQGKTRRIVVAFICDDLRWIIDGIPKNDATTICVKTDGKPWTYEGIKTAFQRHRDSLEANGLIAPGITYHGLRHFVATVLAENGYEDTQYGQLLGHGPKSVSGLYGMSAERRDLLRKMAMVIQETMRVAAGNVVSIGTQKG